MDGRRLGRRLAVGFVAASLSLTVLSGHALAHAAALRDATPTTLEVPTWLFLATGGGAVGASFLLASFVTDRVFIRSFHQWGGTLPSPGRILALFGRLTGLGLLAMIIYVGYMGPPTGYRNFAVVFVWIGWWGGVCRLNVSHRQQLADAEPISDDRRAVSEFQRIVSRSCGCVAERGRTDAVDLD